MVVNEAVQIIVPSWNSERTIRMCLMSLKDLDYPNFKISVIDRFSNDDTKKIAESLGVPVIQKDCNRSEAYNFALGNFNSEYFALVDSDCVLPKNWLDVCMKEIRENGVGAVGGFYKTPKDAPFWNKIIGMELDTRRKRFKRVISRLPTGCLLIKRECLKNVPFDGKLDTAQETDWGYRLASSGYKMIYMPEADVLHYHRDSLHKFFNQQFKYGCGIPEFYLKNRTALKGDDITSIWMNVQPVALVAGLISAILGFWLVILCLFIYWLFLSVKNKCLAMCVIYCVRCFAWTSGLCVWLVRRIKNVF